MGVFAYRVNNKTTQEREQTFDMDLYLEWYDYIQTMHTHTHTIIVNKQTYFRT